MRGVISESDFAWLCKTFGIDNEPLVRRATRNDAEDRFLDQLDDHLHETEISRAMKDARRFLDEMK